MSNAELLNIQQALADAMRAVMWASSPITDLLAEQDRNMSDTDENRNVSDESDNESRKGAQKGRGKSDKGKGKGKGKSKVGKGKGKSKLDDGKGKSRSPVRDQAIGARPDRHTDP